MSTKTDSWKNAENYERFFQAEPLGEVGESLPLTFPVTFQRKEVRTR